MSLALRSIIIGAYLIAPAFLAAPGILQRDWSHVNPTINVVDRSHHDSLNFNISINLIIPHQGEREGKAGSFTATVSRVPVSSAEQIMSPTTDSLSWTVDEPRKVSPLSDHYKIVCDMRGRGKRRFLPEHIDHTICSHVTLGHATLDESSLTIKANSSCLDVNIPYYNLLKSYKQRGIKVMLALGGWDKSESYKYSRMVRNTESRKTFITHALGFLGTHGFDGLHIVWEWPVCWTADCNAGPASDKENFSLLVKELSSAFKPRGLLLSAMVSYSRHHVDVGYNLPVLAEYLDWFSVFTYNYFGTWTGHSGHIAPLYDHPDYADHSLNVNSTINYLMAKGVPSRKMIMEIPLFGQAFTINNPAAGVALNVPAGVGVNGNNLGYYEICERINNQNWTVVKDPLLRMGPYAYKGSQWVSFDDAEMIRHKAQYIRDMDLGGVSVSALEQDDFQGICGEGKYPLMRALRQILADPLKEQSCNCRC